MSKKKKEKLLITIATLITVLQIIPLVIIILNSLRINTEIDVQMLGIPSSLNFENYIVAWTKGGYLQAYGNSLLIGLCSALAILITAGLAVYGLTKMKCFFPRFFRNYFVASLAIPSFAVIVPLYFFFNKLNLVNNLFGMVLIYTATNMPFCFMFMYAFFQGLLKEMDEAARIDGASEIQNLIYNVIPIAKPIFTSISLIVFVHTWNEFLFSNTFLQDNLKRTVSLRFYNFVGRTSANFGYIYAAAIISILPIVIIFLKMQNPFMEGITSGSVKG
jgi:raffinose/stachyose/melibiose transport system permease protein